MRVNLRWNIENKILIPFLTISVLSTTAFGAILYYSGYTMNLARELGTAQSLIGHIESDIDSLYGIADASFIANKYRISPNKNIFIYDSDGSVIQEGSAYTGDANRSKKILAEGRGNALGWKIYYIIDQNEFGNQLIEDQKYIIIATIALMIVTVQVSIFVASNISTPIRKLSDICRDISERPQEALKVGSEYTRRRDEIGRLASSFDRMLSNIQSYTEEILRIKQLNESIVENLPIGVVAYDNHKNILCINTAAQNLVGRTEFTENGVPLSLMLDQIVEHPKLLYDPIRLSDGEGHGIDLALGVWRLADAGQPPWGVLCTLDDITYKKMIEERASENEKLAYAGKLAASLAHEIRNPLAGIRASIQVIGNRLENPPDRLLCDSIIGEVDRINLLIENLVHLSRRPSFKKMLIYVSSLYQELILLYSKIAENNRIEMSADIRGEITLYADENGLKQIFINLINNSIRAIKNKGGIVLGASRGDGGNIVLTVEDNGIGMMREELSDILDETRAGAGRGLGISIVARLLSQNGGRFSIESAAGVGTRFIMTFGG